MTRELNQPLGGNQTPRFGGPATMMCLPTQQTAAGLDVCFVGVPLDIGTSNRGGARFGPRQIRAESCLIEPERMVQIGLRATGYAADDFDWPREQGVRVVQAEACWYKSLAPLMEEVREQLGQGPVYLTFDIDGIDPAHAPGTGTPEIGGLTVPQALEIIRGCRAWIW
jgi:arginase family enzyme